MTHTFNDAALRFDPWPVLGFVVTFVVPAVVLVWWLA